MRRSFAFLSAAVISLLSVGCFEVEQSIELKKDLSGTASFRLGVDMEPMVLIMAAAQKEMGGDKSPLTPDEIARAREDFKKNAKRSSSTTDPRKGVEEGLPPGVTLLDASVTEKELGVTTTMKFAFDKLASLVGVKVAPAREGGGDPTKMNVMSSPFEGLEVSETATTVTIRTVPQNPADEVRAETREQAPQIDPQTEKLINDAFKSLRVAWRITAPFAVVSHNATRRDGNTLIWEYDVEKLQKLGSSADPAKDLAVSVTYRK